MQRLETGAVEITSQNHGYAVADGTVAGADGQPRQPERRGHRGAPLLGRRRPSASSTTPRPAPARTTPATCSRSSGRSWPPADGPARRHLVDPRHRLGPDRHRPGVRVRLLGHPGLPGAAGGGVPGHPRQLEPRHDHDRPRPGGPDLRRAARADVLAAIIERERPDALLPTMGGQTALNLAVQLADRRVSRTTTASSSSAPRSRRSAPPRTATGFKEAMTEIGLSVPESGFAHDMDEALEVAASVGFPLIVRPSFILGGAGTGIATRPRGLPPARGRRPRRQPGPRDPRRAVDRGLEGVRARGDARPRRQLRRRLLDRELRPDGRAHRRLDHRRPGADALRRRVPADARRRLRLHPPRRRRDWRLEHPVRRRPARPAGCSSSR